MNETIKSSEKRIQAIDIAKGILIVCVVIGHGSENDSLSNFVYRFHMPLFLILAGCFVRKTDDIRTWIKARTIRYMLPYFFYMLIDFVFFDRVHNINRLLHYLWGGRFINGVYWYMTCLYAASIIMEYSIGKMSKRGLAVVGIVGGGIAIVESNYIGKMPLLERPGIPFGLDVSLIVLSYLIIGFLLKENILTFFEKKSIKLDVLAIVLLIILVSEHLVMETSGMMRQLDMKAVVYKNSISAYIIPLMYGYVLARLSAMIARTNIRTIIAYLGEITMPIMFLHEPLKRFCTLSNNLLIYLLIGVGIPAILSVMMGRSKYCKLFGIPIRR